VWDRSGIYGKMLMLVTYIPYYSMAANIFAASRPRCTPIQPKWVLERFLDRNNVRG